MLEYWPIVRVAVLVVPPSTKTMVLVVDVTLVQLHGILNDNSEIDLTLLMLRMNGTNQSSFESNIAEAVET